MSKLETLANEKFNGDKNETIRYLISEADKKTIDEIVEDCDRKEADLILKFIFKNVKGTKKMLTNGMKMERNLAFLQMTEDEVKKAASNPYKVKLIKELGSFLIIEVVIIGASIILDYNFIDMIGLVITGILATNMAGNLIKYMKFRSLQKQIKKEEKEISSKNM